MLLQENSKTDLSKKVNALMPFLEMGFVLRKGDWTSRAAKGPSRCHLKTEENREKSQIVWQGEITKTCVKKIVVGYEE